MNAGPSNLNCTSITDSLGCPLSSYLIIYPHIIESFKPIFKYKFYRINLFFTRSKSRSVLFNILKNSLRCLSVKT